METILWQNLMETILWQNLMETILWHVAIDNVMVRLRGVVFQHGTATLYTERSDGI